MLKLLVLVLTLWCGTASAGSPKAMSAQPDPIADMKKKRDEKKAEKEEAENEAFEAWKAKGNEYNARVIVLGDVITGVDFNSDVLQSNVKDRINRDSAKFYDSIDLFQDGRTEPDKTLFALQQRAKVPNETIAKILAKVNEASMIPWDGQSDQAWRQLAESLRSLTDEIWFIDRPELLEPMFMLYAQIGRAADNGTIMSPPFVEQIGSGNPVPYYWYLAGALAHQEPSLLSKINDTELRDQIQMMKQRIDNGDFAKLQVSFASQGQFDAKFFISTYKLMVDGIDRTMEIDADGNYSVPLGVTDVHLEVASGGFSLSKRIETVKLDDDYFFLVNDARAQTGDGLKSQLMENPKECIPDVSEKLLTSIAIYQKLHQTSDVYVAIPAGGSARRPYVWRWVRETGQLTRVQDDRGFPVTFAAMIGAGMAFGGLNIDTESAADDAVAAIPADPPTGPVTASASISDYITPNPEGVPIAYQARMHWRRLMIPIGINMSANVSGGWSEMYQTNSASTFDASLPNNGLQYAADDGTFYVLTEDAADQNPDDINAYCEEQIANGDTESCVQYANPATNNPTWQRLVYTGVGVMLMEDARFGFGPRAYFRLGWANAPHSVSMTGHLGWTLAAQLGAEKRKMDEARTFPLVDFDVYAGTLVPFRDSLMVLFRRNAKGQPKKLGTAIPSFGFTASAGFTF